MTHPCHYVDSNWYQFDYGVIAWVDCYIPLFYTNVIIWQCPTLIVGLIILCKWQQTWTWRLQFLLKPIDFISYMCNRNLVMPWFKFVKKVQLIISSQVLHRTTEPRGCTKSPWISGHGLEEILPYPRSRLAILRSHMTWICDQIKSNNLTEKLTSGIFRDKNTVFEIRKQNLCNDINTSSVYVITLSLLRYYLLGRPLSAHYIAFNPIIVQEVITFYTVLLR